MRLVKVHVPISTHFTRNHKLTSAR